MKVYFLSALAMFGSASIYSGCSGRAEKMTDSAYRASILSERQQKDNDFATNPKSPFALLTEDFTGLKYYDPDPAWRVAISWAIPDTTFVKVVPDSKGGNRNYQYRGDFEFELSGSFMKLPVWQDPEDSSILFIMFRDKTNGKETYGGGRYLEIPMPDRNSDIYLDFNRAFNPYCHYNHNYSCPLVPADCVLNAEVKAGEKMYSVQ